MEIKIEPKTRFERGDIVMMPTKKNVQKGHPGWKLVKCPECGQECWEILGLPGVKLLCTECALGIQPSRKGAQA